MLLFLIGNFFIFESNGLVRVTFLLCGVSGSLGEMITFSCISQCFMVNWMVMIMPWSACQYWGGNEIRLCIIGGNGSYMKGFNHLVLCISSHVMVAWPILNLKFGREVCSMILTNQILQVDV